MPEPAVSDIQAFPSVLGGKVLDPADEQMSIRAWERFQAPRRSA